MPTSPTTQLVAPDPKDPPGFGRKSIPEPLQRWLLIEKGNPYFDAEVRELRLLLGLPEAGFENKPDFVEWAATRRLRHGHTQTIPISFTAKADGQRYEGAENLIRLHYSGISWPLEEHALPGRCCPTDPLFLMAMKLAKRFGIDRAGSEPGFPGPTETVVGYLLVGRWPLPKSLAGMSWTEESNYVDPITHERVEGWNEVVVKGLNARGGEGRQVEAPTQWQKYQ